MMLSIGDFHLMALVPLWFMNISAVHTIYLWV